LLAYRDAVRDEEVVELFFVADNDAGFELYRHELSPTPGALQPGLRLTEDPMDARRNETRTAATVLNGRAYLAWSSDRVQSEPARSEIRGQLVHFQGSSRSVVEESEGHLPSWLSVAELGAAEGEKHGALVWVSEQGDKPGVWLQALDPDGLPVGAPSMLSGFVGGDTTVFVASHESGGAAVYTTVQGSSRELRIQELDALGAPEGVEHRVTSGDERATGASLVAIPGGWVVAYRRSAADNLQSTVRLTFTDRSGNIARVHDVAEASPSGGPVQVRVASDGRILLAWTDRVQDVTTVRALRVICPG